MMARREEEEQVRALFIVAFAHSHSHATSKHATFNTTTRPTTFIMMTISRLCFISASESCSLCLLTKRHSIMLFFLLQVVCEKLIIFLIVNLTYAYSFALQYIYFLIYCLTLPENMHTIFFAFSALLQLQKSKAQKRSCCRLRRT